MRRSRRVIFWRGRGGARSLARDGIRLRQIGQQIVEILGGKRIHPAWVVPGGVSAPLSEEKRDQIQALLPDAIAALERTLGRFRGFLQCFPEEVVSFANFRSLFLGLTDGAGKLEYYDGPLRIVDSDGIVVADDLRPRDYPKYLAEVSEPDSYLKSTYYKPLGYDKGMYRVGPLARLNLVTTLRDAAGESRTWHPAHIRRQPAVELVPLSSRPADRNAVLRGAHERLLASPDILSDHVRAFAEPNCEEGVGVSEAPRGTLLHHYKVDSNGLIRWANLIIATGHNNLAMNRGIQQTASYFVQHGKLSAGALNRVEAVVRAFDPCLSCSTHAAGEMPLEISLVGPDGELLDRVRR